MTVDLIFRDFETWQLRSLEVEGRELDGVVTVYDRPRDVGPYMETMAAGVFDRTLEQHADQVKLLVGHEADAAVGTPVAWRRGDTELGVTFRFGTHEEARGAARMADEGMFGGLSVGFLPGRKEHHNVWTVDEDGAAHVLRREARLLHVALVVTPAVADARILEVRSLGMPARAGMLRPGVARARHMLARVRRDAP